MPARLRARGRARRRPGAARAAGDDGIEETLDALDGLIFSGGADLDPGALRRRRAPGDERDRARARPRRARAAAGGARARHAGARVCRGSQVLNVALGGDLVQHLPDGRRRREAQRTTPGVFADHDVEIEPDARGSAALLGARAPVEVAPPPGPRPARRGSARVRAGATTARVEALEDPAQPVRARRALAPGGRRGHCGSSRRSSRRRAPTGGAALTVSVLNPATEQPIAELDAAGVEETDAAVARAKAAFPAWRAVAPADRARLLRRLATLVEEHGEELARIESRNVGKPISGARGEVGMVARGLPLLRRRGRQALRRDDPGRRRRRPDLPRAARRRRPDRALELPAQHRELEARPGARLRQHGRAEARRAHAALGAAARRARARGRDPGGRRQRARRPGLGRRAAAGRASRRREDRLHRLDRGRARGDAGRRRDDQARHARARRQVGQRRLRRRRPRDAPPPPRRTPSSTTPARTAARARGSSSSAPPTTGSRAARHGDAAASRSAIPRPTRPRWGR